MAFMLKIKEVLQKNRKTAIILLSIMVLGGGALYGWKSYTHAQSPEAYVEKLNAALTSTDLAALAIMIDFRPMTEAMAHLILDSPMPSAATTPKTRNEAELAELIQKAFMESLKNRDAKADDKKQDPLAPIMPLPIDFAKQISGNVTLLGRAQNGAIISVSMQHPQVDKTIPLHFLIEEKPDWKLTKFINFSDVLQAYILEEAALEKGRQKIFKAKRAEDQKRMEQQFRLDDCTAFVHKPAGQKNSMITLRIKGYNKGPFIIRNITFDTKIVVESSGGELYYNHNINTASRLLVGTTLEDSFIMELRPEDESTRILEQAPKLSCQARVAFMTLDNGKVLFVAPDEKVIRKPLQESKESAPKK